MNINPNVSLVHCEKCNGHNRKFCSSANEEALVSLNRISHVRKCNAGEVILSEGEEAEIVGNVISGMLKVTKILSDGREQIVGLLFPTDFFGRAYTDSAEFSIEAATDATICTMERHAFENLIEQYQVIEHQLLVSTFNELDAARDWMVLLGCQNTLEKVSHFFLMLLQRSDQQCRTKIPFNETTIVVFPIGRNDIVSYLGTTVETLSRQIQFLSREGAIRILDAKHFEILDEAKLIKFSGQELPAPNALIH